MNLNSARREFTRRGAAVIAMQQHVRATHYTGRMLAETHS